MIAVAGAGALSAGTSTSAEAAFDICKKAKIKIVNQTGAPIKLFDIDYWDYGSNRKRSENISNRVLANGKSYTIQRNLEGVNNAMTHMIVQFHKLKSNGKWNYKYYWNAKGAKTMCTRGKTFKVVIR